MEYITDINQLDPNKLYTYTDYLTWRFKERVELIMGKVTKMSPAPQSQHQYICAALIVEIGTYLKKKQCIVFSAPFNVRLPILGKDGESNTIVQPDICVICDQSKIDKKGCNGAPELIVEILSDSTADRDLHEKYDMYEKSRVQEYWIVHPNDKTLSIFILDKASRKYVPSKPLTYGDIAESTVLPGLKIDLNEVLQDVVKEPDEDYLPEGTKRLI